MNKQKYFEIGGNDEDFAGNYAAEDTFFGRCLAYHNLRVTHCDHIVLDWRPHMGATKNLPRDKSINAAIFAKKAKEMKDGTYVNGPILRFRWSRVIS